MGMDFLFLRFMGTLDPSKLHAGFAGMNLEVDLLPEQISQFDGLQVNVAKTDTRVAILLKRVDGKMWKNAMFFSLFGCESFF